MEDKYVQINIETPYVVKNEYYVDIIKSSLDVEQFIKNLKKTNHFDKILIKNINNNLHLMATPVKPVQPFSLYKTKKNFLGLKYTHKSLNILKQLDSLTIQGKVEFPIFNLEYLVLQQLRQKYFDKNSLKIFYNKFSYVFNNPYQISLTRGVKNDYKYLRLNFKLINLVSINQLPFDLSFSKVFTTNNDNFDSIAFVKLTHQTNNIQKKQIPKGYKNEVKIKHSIFENVSQFQFSWYFRYFTSIWILPNYSNLQFDWFLQYQKLKNSSISNQLGFKNLIISSSDDQPQLTQFSSLKINFFNILSSKNYFNCFLYLSEIKPLSEPFKFSYGFGIQKEIQNVGNMELIYNIMTNSMQFRITTDQIIKIMRSIKSILIFSFILQLTTQSCLLQLLTMSKQIMNIFQQILEKSWQMDIDEIYKTFKEVQIYYEKCKNNLPELLKMDECVKQIEIVMNIVVKSLHNFDQEKFEEAYYDVLLSVPIGVQFYNICLNSSFFKQFQKQQIMTEFKIQNTNQNEQICFLLKEGWLRKE